MTLGVGTEDRGDLAALMSAAEDRRVASRATRTIEASPSFMLTTSSDPSEGANYAGGSSYSEDLPLGPSSVGLSGLLGVNDGVTQPAILKEIRKTRAYLKRQHGQPYPNVVNQARIAKGYVTPTDTAGKNDLYKGWNAAAQPGVAPGLVEGGLTGFSDLYFGDMTYAQALNYSPAPLTDNLGSLRNFDQVQPTGTPTPQPPSKAGGLMFFLLAGVAAWGLYGLFRDAMLPPEQG